MPARKRDSTEAETSEATPATKIAKTSNGSGASKEKTKKVTKAPLTPAAFKSNALPLHLNLTHTPPVIPAEDSATATSADPGQIGSATLLPTTFSTGSYGWKGNKRVVIEVENPETGEKEKLQINVSINATVIGSKNTKDGDDDETEGLEKDNEEDS